MVSTNCGPSRRVCRELGLSLHMDGDALPMLAPASRCSPADMTWRVGIDVLCFGGTKNGMAAGEAILFFNRKLQRISTYRCKQAGQLAIEDALLSAPWVGMLGTGTWLRNAEHAKPCATRLLQQIAGLPELESCFRSGQCRSSSYVGRRIAALRDRGWHSTPFIGGGARFMFAWDTAPQRVDELAADLRQSIGLTKVSAVMSKKSSESLDPIENLVAPFRVDGSGEFHLKSHRTMRRAVSQGQGRKDSRSQPETAERFQENSTRRTAGRCS